VSVSFGLFGDQGVFKSEATGAAQVVARRFGNGPIDVQYNSKRGGGATIEALAMSLQVAAKGMDAENDVLFLILTAHGSRAGLAVKAGRLTQTLTPSMVFGTHNYLLGRPLKLPRSCRDGNEWELSDPDICALPRPSIDHAEASGSARR
jgi:hypothetical protein